MSYMRSLVLIASCAIAGCAGNGEGLDANGRPLMGGGDGGGGNAALTPDLKSIQDNVFTPICTQCHQGAAAPLGLRLDAASSYAMLVNAPSVEVPALNRVTPGDPDNSYLIQKLEGRAAVGGQMPLGQPPLPAATIAAIRQWITNGAPQAQALTDVMPMQVRAVAPPPGEALSLAQPEILLEASGTLNVATLTPANVVLVRSGGDGSFGDGNDVAMGPVQIEVRSLQPTVIALKLPAGDVFVPDRYRLTLAGHGAQPVRDRDGLPIGDFVLQFSVGGAL
ncbi:MAG TPA: hypothetical protein VFS52_06625 [Steroidobacteraceae bacterium]|nr:hypothetical protein [Steroidobacteraceae bacterium]